MLNNYLFIYKRGKKLHDLYRTRFYSSKIDRSIKSKLKLISNLENQYNERFTNYKMNKLDADELQKRIDFEKSRLIKLESDKNKSSKVVGKKNSHSSKTIIAKENDNKTDKKTILKDLSPVTKSILPVSSISNNKSKKEKKSNNAPKQALPTTGHSNQNNLTKKASLNEAKLLTNKALQAAEAKKKQAELRKQLLADKKKKQVALKAEQLADKKAKLLAAKKEREKKLKLEAAKKAKIKQQKLVKQQADKLAKQKLAELKKAEQQKLLEIKQLQQKKEDEYQIKIYNSLSPENKALFDKRIAHKAKLQTQKPTIPGSRYMSDEEIKMRELYPEQYNDNKFQDFLKDYYKNDDKKSI